MKVNNEILYDKIYGNEFNLVSITNTLDKYIINLKSKSNKAICPICGKTCTRKHSTYNRTLQDTPIRGKNSVLKIKAYNYYCDNNECLCHIFSEELTIAPKNRRRTSSLDLFILSIACEFSSEGASRILKRLGVSVSNDTIDRIISRIEIKDNPNIEKIGVDDFAYRKGQTYCTAIYDLETHKPIAVLNGRNGEELKCWLSGHKKVQIVARDRDCSYAKAIRDILPECHQTADKFHLMQNLLSALKEIAKLELPKKINLSDNEVTNEINCNKEVDIKDNKIDISRLKYDGSPIVDTKTGEIIIIRTKFSKNYSIIKKK